MTRPAAALLGLSIVLAAPAPALSETAADEDFGGDFDEEDADFDLPDAADVLPSDLFGGDLPFDLFGGDLPFDLFGGDVDFDGLFGADGALDLDAFADDVAFGDSGDFGFDYAFDFDFGFDFGFDVGDGGFGGGDVFGGDVFGSADLFGGDEVGGAFDASDLFFDFDFADGAFGGGDLFGGDVFADPPFDFFSPPEDAPIVPDVADVADDAARVDTSVDLPNDAAPDRAPSIDTSLPDLGVRDQGGVPDSGGSGAAPTGTADEGCSCAVGRAGAPPTPSLLALAGVVAGLTLRRRRALCA